LDWVKRRIEKYSTPGAVSEEQAGREEALSPTVYRPRYHSGGGPQATNPSPETKTTSTVFKRLVDNNNTLEILTRRRAERAERAGLYEGEVRAGRIPTAFVAFLIGEPVVSEGDQQRLAWSLWSACNFHPHAQLYVLTDKRTDFDFTTASSWNNGPCVLNIRRVHRVNVYEHHKRQLMKVRIQAEYEFLQDMAENRELKHVVFHDTDVAFTGSVAQLWQDRFDVAFTYQDKPDHPLDVAVKFVHGAHGNLKVVAKLWQESLKGYDPMCNECNSDAFLKALTMGMPTSESAALFERVVRESTWHYNWDVPGFATLDIQMMPCNIYNAMPGSEAMCGCSAHRTTKVLHFKGNLQQMQSRYMNEIELGRSASAVQMAMDAAGQFKRSFCGSTPVRKKRLHINNVYT